MKILNKCRRHSKGTLMSFLVGICLLYIFMNWVPEVIGLFVPGTNIDVLMRFADEEGKAMLQKMPATPLIFYIYGFFLNGAFRLGECLYTLTYIRNKKAEYSALTEGFSVFGKAFGLYLMQTLIILFWSMFFIIPGIITAINFSQSFYLLADDPSKGITQILAESKLMMLGNRMTYLRTLIVFLPYLLFGYMPALLVSYFITPDMISNVAYTVIALVAEIPIFAAFGFMELGKCTFYELLINKGFENFRYSGQEVFRQAD